MIKHRLFSILTASFVFTAIVAHAGQNNVGGPSSNPDITWITTPILQVLGMIILGFGSWATQRLLAWLNVKISAQAAANMDQALQKAITFGIQEAQDTIRTNGWDHPTVRSKAVQAALPYMQTHFADTLKRDIGTVGTNTTVTNMIEEALKRAFPEAAAKAAASPATPPISAPTPQTTAEWATQPNVQQVVTSSLTPAPASLD